MLFAHACGKAGQIERSLAALDKSIAFSEPESVGSRLNAIA